MSTSQSNMDDFYRNLETLPKLIGDLALSVAEAQRRMDQNYLDNLSAIAKIASNMAASGPAAVAELQTLMTSISPQRYQFTETTVEVRADLQMSNTTDFSIGGSVGFPAPYAVTVNASYAKRNGYDYQAAALVRTVLHAESANESVMTNLLNRVRELPALPMPQEDRYRALADSLSSVLHPQLANTAAVNPTPAPAPAPLVTPGPHA